MFIKLYAVALSVFLAIDLVWLGFIAKSFYGKYLGHLMREGVNWPAAIVFYLLFVAGLVMFVIYPAVDRHQWYYALGAGAAFGLITYATYDLTNLATIKDWPLVVTIVDMVWGMVLAASVSLVTYLVAVRIMG